MLKVSQTPRGSGDLAAALRGARSGDQDAFLVMYRLMQPHVLRYLQVIVGNDAEDVASETWLHIAKDLPGFRGNEDTFKAWAVKIARHRAMDHLRYHQRRPAVPVPVDSLTDRPGAGETADLALEQLSTSQALAIIATLPTDQAEAILLRVVIGLDAQSAAKIMGKRAGAVRTAAYRGLKRLADKLAGQIGGHHE